MSDLARAAAIQQTLATPGWRELSGLADGLLSGMQQVLSIEEHSDEELVALLREWRGAERFWKQLKRAAEAATQIETEPGENG